MTPLLLPCHSPGWHHGGAGKVVPVQPRSLSHSEQPATSRLSSARVLSQAQGQGGAGGAVPCSPC